MHFVGLFLSSLLKMHGPKNKIILIFFILPFGGRQLLLFLDFIPIKITNFQQKILFNKLSNFFTKGSLSFSLEAMPRLRQFDVRLLPWKPDLDPSSILVPFLLEKLAMAEVYSLMKSSDVNISRVIIVLPAPVYQSFTNILQS